MKKLLPVLLLLLVVLGCEKKPGEDIVVKELDYGLVNFAAILVLDDLIINGAKSDFVSISPLPLLNPDNTVTAQAILDEFRNDFKTAVNQYPLKLSEGISITWDLDQDADAQPGLTFHVEKTEKNATYLGKLSLHFDPQYYSASPYPTYSGGSGITIICHEFSSALERKNDSLQWLEVSLDKCLEATDYYSSIRNQLENQQAPLVERLTEIYEGNEPVSPRLAQKLAAYYEAGYAFAPDSVCLTGSHEACLHNLKAEIIRKHEDVQPDSVEGIYISILDPDGKQPAARQKPASEQQEESTAQENRSDMKPDGESEPEKDGKTDEQNSADKTANDRTSAEKDSTSN